MQIIRCIFILLFLFLNVQVNAQVKYGKGQASEKYTNFFGGAPVETKQKALQKAQLRAIEAYYAEAGESETASLDTIRDKLAADLDKFILDTQVLNEQDNKDLKQYTVTIRASINVAQLRNAVKGSSATGTTARAQRSPLVFMFVSRQQDSIKEFDDRVYKRVDATAKDEFVATQSKSTKTPVKSIKETAESKSSESIETGGSRTRRGSEATFKIIPSSNLNSTIAGIFTSSGFKVYQAALVEPVSNGLLRISDIENDYKSGNDLQPATLQNAINGVRAAKAQYLAIGTLDVGLPLTDAGSGLYRVAVTVNAKIMDVSTPIPEELALVGPVQYAAVAPTEDEARTAALKLAGDKAARELMSQVNNTGVK